MYLSVVPTVAGVCVKQNPCAGLGPPGLDSQAASFTTLWISDWLFGKVTPQLILSNPFHGHRLSQPSIHLTGQTMLPHPSPPALPSFSALAPSWSQPSSWPIPVSPTLLHAPLAIKISPSVSPPLNNYWMNCHEIHYNQSCFLWQN